MRIPKAFPKKEENVQSVTDAGGSENTVRSNRPQFKLAAYAIVLLWMMVFMFGLAGIWAPAFAVAANFESTAWFFFVIAVPATIAWLWLANEFMDLDR